MKLKKIIIFYPSFERGGVEIILLNLINHFLKKKIKIVLISNVPKTKLPKSNNFLQINPNYTINNFFSDRLSKAVQASKELLKILKFSNPKETIIFSLQSSSIAILVSKINNYRIVVRNAEDPIYSTIYGDNKISSIFAFISKILTYNFSDKIICNSVGSKNSIQKLLFNKSKAISIYNPYLKKINKNKNLSKKNFIITVGRLTKQKDHQTLVQAMKILHKKGINLKLFIIGDGDQKKKIQHLINRLHLKKNIKLLGWKKNVKSYYKSAKIFVLSSLYEGLGNVVIDAVNYNIPVVTTNCKSGPSEIIKKNKGGFIVPVSNPQKIATKIFYCLKNYKLALNKAGYAKKYIYRFSVKENSEKYYKELIKAIYEKN
tara:strand:- start:8426 stop:9547 length:1122 start_codon:yes stop_codon:yes gene_type:complete